LLDEKFTDKTLIHNMKMS